jgi:hypothetical protein
MLLTPDHVHVLLDAVSAAYKDLTDLEQRFHTHLEEKK